MMRNEKPNKSLYPTILALTRHAHTIHEKNFIKPHNGRALLVIHIPYPNLLPDLRFQVLLQNQKTTLQKPPTKPTFAPHHRPPPSLKTPCPTNFLSSVPKIRPRFLPPLRLSPRCRRIIALGRRRMLHKNDIVLANRPCFLMGMHISYNYTTILASPYGDHWRNLRRIWTVEIFSLSRLNLFLGIRRVEIKRLLRKISRNSVREEFEKVALRSMLPVLTYNIIMRMVAGKRYYGDRVTNEKEAREFREINTEIENGGAATLEIRDF
ncbi:Cytochrome P [Parasponia andersonii]|uniref:Cytochrome P n=1 Tax=Parasponia andersonii TaxID=3476 RepID=A0A2P5BMB6_PARAD|nr:Cytochrome P [Parasponia andersonii]